LGGWAEAAHALRVRKQRIAKGLRNLASRQVASAWDTWCDLIDRKRETRERVRVAAVKIASGKLRRALNMWAQQIVDDQEERATGETAARHDVEVQALMAEVDRLGIDNRRLIRQVEQLMGTQDVAATLEPKSAAAPAAGGTGSAVPSPRGPRRAQAVSEPQETPGIGRIEHEVAKLHNVIAEMAEREERLLRMLQLPDVKPEPAQIKNTGDFVRKNRALVHHTSSFNSLLRQLRKEALEKGDKALLVNVDKMAYANLCADPLLALAPHSGRSQLTACLFGRYVTDGDLHVQAVDVRPSFCVLSPSGRNSDDRLLFGQTLPTPNPRGKGAKLFE